MKDVRVAKRYAAALFSIAQRDGILDAVTQDLQLIERFLAEVPYLRAVIMQPLVSEERKTKVAGDAFSDRVTLTSLNFLKLLIRKRREVLIDEVIREFRVMSADYHNIIDATVTTVIPLSATQQEQLSRSLNALTGKKVQIATEIDPSIIGGTVVRFGDTVIDGSVRSRLERLEQQLLGGRTLGGVS